MAISAASSRRSSKALQRFALANVGSSIGYEFVGGRQMRLHVLLDSFWYGEGIYEGVTLWEDAPALMQRVQSFPAGLAAATSAWPPALWIASQWCPSHRHELGPRKTRRVLAHNLRRVHDASPNDLSRSDSRQRREKLRRVCRQRFQQQRPPRLATQISSRPLHKLWHAHVHDEPLGLTHNH